VERYFEGALSAIEHKKWCDENGLKLLRGIQANHPVIPLKPGERILAHTHEFFGIKPPGAFELKSRSSWGRNGIAVCIDAGWVDPGYINRLTLEIYNLNHKETVLLPVGERIAQAVFHETGPVRGNYGEGRHGGFSGKYQSGTDLNQLIKNWRPEMMLPRAYLDKRSLPKPIKGLKGL
jgi:deoxycytidine triphosphate deaminase